MSLSVRSSAFSAGAAIPKKHTCDGADLSPALSWSGAPAGAREYALVCEDPDAPSGTFVHWVVWGIPAGTQELPEGAGNASRPSLPAGALQGRNGFGSTGYRGPCPPPGRPHRYFLRIFALDGAVTLREGASRGELDRAMSGHVVAQGEVAGKYGR